MESVAPLLLQHHVTNDCLSPPTRRHEEEFLLQELLLWQRDVWRRVDLQHDQEDVLLLLQHWTGLEQTLWTVSCTQHQWVHTHTHIHWVQNAHTHTLKSAICLTLDEFAILCGSERPGYYIDIYTGQVIGKLHHFQWKDTIVIKSSIQLHRTNKNMLSYSVYLFLCLCVCVPVYMCVFQTLMSAGKSQVCVRTACVSTWLAASGVSVQWASSTMTSCSSVKVRPAPWASCCVLIEHRTTTL